MILIRFPTHTVPPNTTRNEKENLLHDLKCKLSKGMVEGVTSFHLTLPLVTIHNRKIIGFGK